MALMKRVLLGLTLTVSLLSSTGCNLLGHRACNSCNGPVGCRPCNLGWQRGGTDYQRFLSHHGGAGGHLARYGNAQPAGAGGAGAGPAAQVAYPYDTTRGPRDFLMDNPPTIGR
jgi:hypothetical protein